MIASSSIPLVNKLIEVIYSVPSVRLIVELVREFGNVFGDRG